MARLVRRLNSLMIVGMSFVWFNQATMGYTVEESGTRRYKINSKREIISPSEGHDFIVDRVKTRIGRLAVLRGRIFRPVDKPDDPVNVLSVNGWSAPASVYYGVSSTMASHGVATAVYDVYKPPMPSDFKDPLHAAENGGLAMIDILQDAAGDDDLAVIGHSMGALTGLRVTLQNENVKHFIAEAPAGIEHQDMWKSYIKRMPAMAKDEFAPLFKYLLTSRFGTQTLAEFTALNMTDPTRLLRQAWMLGQGPDLAPMLDASHHVGANNGVIIHENDEFFHVDKQVEIINRKKHLFDAVRKIEGTKHLHPNMFPKENAAIRLDILNELRAMPSLVDAEATP